MKLAAGALALSLLTALPAIAETRSTLCQATPVTVAEGVTDRRLLGCGAGFPDNLLWHLDRSDTATGVLDQRVQYSVTGNGALVYVIDTGILASHDEFARASGSNVIAGLLPDAAMGNRCANAALAPCWDHPNVLMLYSHGTGVASVVGGARIGVAPDARIVSVFGPFTAETWPKGIAAILAHAFAPTTPPFRTAIINISGGVAGVNSSNQASFDATIRRMTEGVDANGNPDPNGKRFLFVTAAGNSGQCAPNDEVMIYPGTIGTAIDGVVTVGGLSRTNTLWSGSCKGSLVEVLAPAEEIFLASLGGNDLYRFQPEFFISGTSYSTPYVSGMAARLLEIHPNLTPAELEQRLKASPSIVSGYPVPVMPAAPSEPWKKRRSVR